MYKLVVKILKLILPNTIRKALINWIFVLLPRWISHYSVNKHMSPVIPNKEYLLAIPESLSFGDPLIYFEYARLLSEEQKRHVAVIIPPIDMCKTFVEFFFGNIECHIYSEPLYDLIVGTFPKLRSITSNFGRNLNIFICRELRVRLEGEGYMVVKTYETNYDESKDENYLAIKEKRGNFAKAYIEVNKRDNKYLAMAKFWSLVSNSSRDSKSYPGYSQCEKDNLLTTLGITRKYVCLHIREYGEFFSGKYNEAFETDPRAVHSIENYLPAIRFLVDKGYQVVRVGYKSANRLPQLDGFIDYSNSEFQNPKNDIYLCSDCAFFIGCKSGVEVLPFLFGRPILGLNYVGLYNLLGIPNLRYVPKGIVGSTRKALSLSEALNHETFFSQFADSYNRNGIKTEDLDSEMIVEATQEMVTLVEDPLTEWGAYTDLQRRFREMIRPEHMELYRTQSAPCNCYLRRVME